MLDIIKKVFSIISLKIKLRFLCCAVISVFMSYFTTYTSVLAGNLFDEISNGTIASLNQSIKPVLIFAFISLLSQALQTLYVYCFRISSEKTRIFLRTNALEKILKSDVSYHEKVLSGERSSQIARGVGGVTGTLQTLVDPLFSTCCIIFFTIYQITKIAPIELVYIILGYMVVFVLLSLLFAKLMIKPTKEIVNQENNLSGQINQSIQNIEYIRSVNGFNYERNRLELKINNIFKDCKKLFKIFAFSKTSKSTFELLCLVAIIFISCFFIQKGTLKPGATLAILFLFRKFMMSIYPLSYFMSEFTKYLVEAKQFVELLSNKEDDLLNIKGMGVPQNGEKIITINSAYVLNPQRNKTLGKYENIVIDATKITGLRGITGSGKTTLIRAITRYYPLESGDISIFGKDLKTFSHKELTDTILYLPQTSFFFMGTVKENLVYGLDKEVDKETLIEILRKTNLTGNTKGGIETKESDVLDYKLTEGALNLSGGQRQRLALARALLRTPKLFILDESSANLDKKTTNTVLTNIETYAKSIGAGIVYISHDTNVLSRCDEIIDISKDNKVSNF